jgi:hypothetical protein
MPRGPATTATINSSFNSTPIAPTVRRPPTPRMKKAGEAGPGLCVPASPVPPKKWPSKVDGAGNGSRSPTAGRWPVRSDLAPKTKTQTTATTTVVSSLRRGARRWRR